MTGLNLTLYKDKAGFINNVSVGGTFLSIWAPAAFEPGSYWNLFTPSQNGTLWGEVFVLSQSVTFGQYWTLTNSYFNFIAEGVNSNLAGPCGAGTGCSFFPVLVWDEVKLSLNDSFTGWPITFNPFVTLYYQFDDVLGEKTSAACFSCTVNNYDFFIGMTPTINLQQYWGIPVTVKAPTYVTVGPSSFWHGNPNGVAATASSGDVGVFTTGLDFIVPLKFLPPQYGNWSASAGFQWYDVVNASLQASNAAAVGTSCGGAVPSSSCTSSILVGYAGLTVGF